MAGYFAKLDAGFYRNPKIRKAGPLGRDVFVFLLCTNADRDSSGIIPASFVEPWYLSDSIQRPESDVVAGLQRAKDAGLIDELEDGSVRLLGFDSSEWGRGGGRSMSEADRKREQRARERAGKIETYIVRAGDTMKIGRSENARARIAELQTGNPVELEIVKILVGDYESGLHEALADYHIRGEWFSFSEASVAKLQVTLPGLQRPPSGRRPDAVELRPDVRTIREEKIREEEKREEKTGASEVRDPDSIASLVDLAYSELDAGRQEISPGCSACARAPGTERPLVDRLMAHVPKTDRRRALNHALAVLRSRARKAGVIDDLRMGYLGGERSWFALLDGQPDPQKTKKPTRSGLD
jgi:hypothetical protein